jgi:cytochrome d ubiquinol oxidase subunit II
MLAAGYFIINRRSGWAFILTLLSIVFAVTSIFEMLYPRVLVSSLDPQFSLTIYNAASGPYTLKVMLIIALIFLPFVLGYQVWAYWVYRGRVGSNPEELHY